MIPEISGRIGAELEKIGLDGSPTRVVKTAPPPPRNTVTRVLAGTPAESAER